MSWEQKMPTQLQVKEQADGGRVTRLVPAPRHTPQMAVRSAHTHRRNGGLDVSFIGVDGLIFFAGAFCTLHWLAGAARYKASLVPPERHTAAQLESQHRALNVVPLNRQLGRLCLRH